MIVAADACTILRVLLAPLFAWVLAGPDESGATAFVICLVAVVTDFADGRLARASGWASDRRRIFDHGADIVFLVPGLAMLAHVRRVPALLPWAAALAFGLYAIDGWRRGQGDGIALAPSRPGGAAGVANYAVAVLATGALWLGSGSLASIAYAAGVVAAALNLVAALDRMQMLALPGGAGTRA